jgi:hypothetical protein
MQAVDHPSASLLGALAAAHAALGQLAQAQRVAQQALEKAAAEGDPALAESIRRHLRLDHTGKAVSRQGP